MKFIKTNRIKIGVLLLLAVMILGVGSCVYMPDPEKDKPVSIPRNITVVKKEQQEEREYVENEQTRKRREAKERAALVVVEEPVPAPEDDFEFENVFGKAGITKYSGEATSIILPDSLGGLPLGVICEYAFSGKPMTCVYAPDTVEEVQNEAFNGCIELRSIRMFGVERIGDRAFCGCENLNSAFFSSRLTWIGQQAFASCSKLSEVILGNDLTHLGKGAFLFSGITTIDFPATLETIPEESCYHCDNLEVVTIAEGVKEIGRNAFGGCGKLTEVTVPSSVENLAESAFTGVEKVICIEGDNGLFGWW